MARSLAPPTSKSALQQQEEADAALRRAEVPIFSREGLSVHGKKIALITIGVIALLLLSVIGVSTLTSPAQVDLSSSSSFVQAKSGDLANFSLTVRNTAVSGYAYETHVLDLPPLWSVLSGEDAFALGGGASKQLTVSLRTGSDAPPGRDYNFTVKVLVKPGDLNRTLASRSIPLNVRIVPSAIGLAFESRVTLGTFASSTASADFAFSSAACGAPTASINFEAPGEANITSAGFTVNYGPVDPNATGWLAADIGADGSLEGNVSLLLAGSRLNVNATGFLNYTRAHPPTPGSNFSIPIDLWSCTNGTAWNVTLNNALLNYQRPTAPGELAPVDAANPTLPQGTAHLIARLSNNESRALTLVLDLPGIPKGWDISPPLGSTPVTIAPRTSTTLDLTLRIAKTAPAGPTALNFTACVQANPRDCAAASAGVQMPQTTHFTVKTYVEPSTLKEVLRGRYTDVLLIAQNTGNTPTGFTIQNLPRPGVSVSFFDGSGIFSNDTEVTLALGAARPFAMRVASLPGAAASVYSVNPVFRNDSAAVSQSNLFLSFNVVDITPDSKPAAIGNRLSVDYLGATADGALLTDTNMFGMLPLLDRNERPTHPNYTRPETSGVTPYEVSLKEFANYTGTDHKGFEAFLEGLYQRETRVMFLSPAQTQLRDGDPHKLEALVFEVRITIITPESTGP